MAKTKKIKYRAASSCPYTDKDAQIIGDELSSLRDMMDGEIRPKDVLEYSKDLNSPLYAYFDWDNKSAANKWRINQARGMLRFVYVEIDTNDGPRVHRAMVSITSTKTNDKRYVSTIKALAQKEYRDQVINAAMKQATMWRNKYREYKELASIFKAIDNWDA